jgi:hypothetical protein
VVSLFLTATIQNFSGMQNPLKIKVCFGLTIEDVYVAKIGITDKQIPYVDYASVPQRVDRPR